MGDVAKVEAAERVDPVKRITDGIADGLHVFVVRGAAGTGKTTLIGRLIPKLEKLRYNSLLLAPTGRAAKMIQFRTGHPASTIHSAIYQIDEKPKEGKAERGDLRWVFPIKREKTARTCFIIDEASMVGSALQNDSVLQFGSGSLLQDLIDYSDVELPTSENVVIFVGDPYQLPPVKEKAGEPPALSEDHLSGLTGRKVMSVELIEVHRQNRGSGILAEADCLRAQIAYRLFGEFCFKEHNDIRTVEDDSLERIYHPERNLNEKMLIAYTNERVWELNGRVRRMLGRASVLPGSGERLLSLRNTTVGIGGEREARFMNGDFLQVISADAGSLAKLDGYYRPRGVGETFHYEFTFCRMTLGWLYEDGRLDAEVWVNVTPILSPEYRENPEYASIALYVAVTERIRVKFGLGYSAKDDELLRDKLKQSQFYHAPWVTFGYAITGHKSQGGEWNEVWVDYRYQQNRMTEEYFRWMYTVTTRAKKLLFTISPPRLDDLADALERGIKRLESEMSAPSGNPMVSQADASLSLQTILARHGYAVGATVRRPYALHLRLAGQDDPFAEMGTLDLSYNGKNVISYVRLTFSGAGDALGADIAALKGRKMESVFPETKTVKVTTVTQPKVEVVESHERLRDRLLTAAEKAELRVMGMKSMTVHQLRVELASDLGEGYVDFYIDGKSRVSEMGSMTVGAASLKRLLEGLSQ